MHNKKIPLSIRFSQFVLFIAVLFLIYIGYLIFQSAPKVDTKQPIQLDKTTVTTGQTINLLPEYCVSKDMAQKVDIQLIDLSKNNSAYTIYSVDEAQLKKGCHKEKLPVEAAHFQAFSIPSGTYKLRIRATTKVSLIRFDVKRTDSETFKYIR